MVLNYIWLGFFIIAFLVALIRTIGYYSGSQLFVGFDNRDVFISIIDSVFEMAEFSLFSVSLPLAAVMTFWLGIMKIGEKAGLVEKLSNAISPLFLKLFPEVPKGHPAQASIMMNVAANMLGLDNAATPFGLKAMEDLQSLNPKKDVASNAQIMFLVLNTSGLTIIPASIIAYRAGAGAANPSDIFLPILLATFIASLAGLLVVSIWQKINLFQPVILAFIGGITLLLTAFVVGIYWVTSDVNGNIIPYEMGIASKLISGSLILFIILIFLLAAMKRKLDAFGHFIDGAKEGFNISIKILPYILGILVAIAAFRASGAFDFITNGLHLFFGLFTGQTQFVEALPTAIMRPVSGSGARGMMLEAMKTHGPDSFAGTLSSVFQGSTETTFYVIAVYFGAVGIKHTRYAVTVGLLADLAGIIASIIVCYFFFSNRL